MNIYNKPLKFVNLDDIHWKGNNLLSKNKTMNFAISGRIPGKSTFFNTMLYRQWYEKNRRFLYIKRLIADITESAINDISKNINKFLDDDSKIKFVYQKGNLKSGVCDVYCYPAKQEVSMFKLDDDHLFFRILSLSIPLDRVKGQILPNLEWIYFDEFMVSKKLGGKYLPYEAEIFGQFYRTFYRESENLRCIFCGNPYSKYSPYTAWLKMNLTDIKVGNIYSGGNWAIEYIQITPELRQWVIEHDSMMDLESEELAMFSLEGKSIEDDNLRICQNQPQNCPLIYLFKYNGKYIGVYRKVDYDLEIGDKYWIQVMPPGYSTKRRLVTCFDVVDLAKGGLIFDGKEKIRFNGLIRGYRSYLVTYADLEAASLFSDIMEYLL